MTRCSPLKTFILAALCGLLITLSHSGHAQSPSDAIDDPQRLDFDQRIAPLLAKRCLTCHSGSAAKGELDLSTHQSALRGGSSGEAAIAKDASSSPLWHQVESDSMPPEHPLRADEKLLIRNWLDRGAAWGSDPIDPFQFTSDVRAGRDWWSLQPLVTVKPSEGNIHPIDSLLEPIRTTHGLSANPQANKRTLIRRLTFDLIGLPPTREEIEQFLADEVPTLMHHWLIACWRHPIMANDGRDIG